MQIKSEQNINDAALAYMEKKYGEKFTYVAPWGDSLSGNHELLVTCDSLKGKKILVRAENYKTNERKFSDNYLAYKYYDDTVKYLENCANEIVGESKVIYVVSELNLSSVLDANATFSDFLADKECSVRANIIVNSDNFSGDSQIEQIAEKVFSGFTGDLNVIDIMVINNDDYNELTDEIYMEIANTQRYIRYASCNNKYDSLTITWIGEESK